MAGTGTKKVVEKVVQAEHDVEDVISDVVHETRVSFKPKSKAGRKFRIFIKRDFPKWLARNNRYVFVTLLVLFISGYSFVKISNLQSEILLLQSENGKQIQLNETVNNQKQEIQALKERLSGSSFVIVNRDTLLADMTERFPNISPRVSKVIVDTIIEEAKKYDLNPIILYSLGVVESSHRYWIEHAKVMIEVPNANGAMKKIQAEAVGWGGVMWEHHHKMLIEKGIAKTRADLFYPDVNIRASAAIYNMYFQMPLKDGVKNQDVSAQRRYFGGNYKAYSDKINAQVVALVNAEIYRAKISDKENVK